jgi:TRAP-type mannitol/chloroaromatic compound transport system permease small subunit
VTRAVPALLGLAQRIDRFTDLWGRVFAWLVLLIVLLLFAQLPLREWIGRYHLLANDFGQIAHAWVFCIGIAYAMRWDGHVRMDLFYQRMRPRTRAAVNLFGNVAFVAPWAIFIFWQSLAMAQRSVLQLESFPDTFNPGYWLFKVLLVLAPALILIQCVALAARNAATLLSPPGEPA